jgi:glycosyltransferase involved in cell wall biosynthesis
VSGKNSGAFQGISAWIRGNLFIPDPRRFWIRPSVKFLTDYIKENEIDFIITTGPPHSLHLIGLKLKNRFPQIRWIADFRDPWSEWGLWDSLSVSNIVRRLHRKMEAEVLTRADEITTITPFYVQRFEALAKRPVKLLTNGFDAEDFQHVTYQTGDKFMIRHIGVINEKCDPRPFMHALQSELVENKSFATDVRVEFIGEVHPDFRRYIEENAILKSVTDFKGNIPHQQLMKIYGSSALLLLILTGYKDAEGFLPGKLFEYLATGLPVLGVGPTRGDAADLLKETGAGALIDSGDLSGIRMSLRGLYKNWQIEYKANTHSAVSKYSRKELTGKLVEILSVAGGREGKTSKLSFK